MEQKMTTGDTRHSEKISRDSHYGQMECIRNPKAIEAFRRPVYQAEYQKEQNRENKQQ